MMKRVGIALAAAGLLATSQASATTYCYTSGGFSACASAVITVSGGQTQLSVALQNLSNVQGNTVYTITQFGLYYLVPPPFTGTMTMTSHPGPAGSWLNGVNNSLTNPGPQLQAGQSTQWVGGARTANGVNYSLAGCPPFPNNNATLISTCASPATFVFSLSAGSNFSLTNLNFALRGQAWTDVPGSRGLTPAESFKCYSTDPNCVVSTVPEPATMGLLGLGLVSIGGVGLLRRRRQNRGK